MNTGLVLDKLDAELDYQSEEDCKYLANLLQHNNLNCEGDKLIGFYNKLVKSRNPLEYTHLLKDILNDNPGFVCEELKENVRSQLTEKKENHVHKIEVSHDVEYLYEELLKKHHDEAIQLLVEILTIVYDATQFEIEGAEIYNSTEFFCFQRTTGEHFASDLIEDSANILIDDFLKNIDSDVTKRYVAEFSKSRHEGFVFIALYVYTSYPEIFKDDVYDIIESRQVLANAPSWVEYQAVEALKMTFGLMTDEQKKAIIERILAIADKGEYILFKDVVEMRLQYGHPILDIDIHKGKALEVIPIEELKSLSWEAYQERQRIDRKFNPERLKNRKPSSSSMHTGWTSLRKDQGMKMSTEAWLNSMLKYTNDPFDWEKPSLTGQCHLFREVVSKEPDSFLDFIHQITKDNRILIAYVQAGMQGLMDAGRMDDAMHVLEGILEAIEIAAYKDEHPDKKIVLVIEDMDRMDPAHLFRILNVFSAHIDYNYRFGVNSNQPFVGNKFGLNKVVFVMSFENTEHIFHHLYGEGSDFNGYISKFCSSNIFCYSFSSEKEECHMIPYTFQL